MTTKIYTIAFITSILIGIDCAIAAAFSMSLMGGFFALPIVIGACATAGFILNTIIYSNDLPSVLDDLFNNNEKTTSPLAQRVLTNTAALISSAVLALFTFYAYTTMAIVWINPVMIGIFCTAYFIGNFALLRCAFNSTYQDTETINDKITDIIPNKAVLLLTIVFTGIMLTAAVFLSLSLVAGASSGLATLGFIAPPILIYAVASILIATEAVFATKAAIWLGHKIHTLAQGSESQTEQANNTWKKILMGFGIGLVAFNGLGNGAIAAAGGSTIKAFFGGTMSLGVMLKSINETAELKEEAQNAIRLTAYILAIGIGVSMISVLSTLGVANPIMLSIATTVSLIAVVAIVDAVIGNCTGSAGGDPFYPMVAQAEQVTRDALRQDNNKGLSEQQEATTKEEEPQERCSSKSTTT